MGSVRGSMYVCYVCYVCDVCDVCYVCSMLCCTPSYAVLYSQLCCAVLLALLCCTPSCAVLYSQLNYHTVQVTPQNVTIIYHGIQHSALTIITYTPLPHSVAHAHTHKHVYIYTLAPQPPPHNASCNVHSYAFVHTSWVS